MSKFYFIFYSIAIFLSVHSFDRNDPINVFVIWLSLFSIYIISFRYLSDFTTKQILCLGILLRIVTVGAIPSLSDDFYRFLWDGYLVSHSINPFAFSPNEFLEQGVPVTEEALSLYRKMNSQPYYSVYPPLLQILFYLPWFFVLSFFAKIILLQFVLLCFETVNLSLIGGDKSKKKFWIYAGNPLVIIESVSQIHPEPILVFLILLSYRLFEAKKFVGFHFVFSLFLQIKLSLVFLIPGGFFLLPKKKRIFFIFAVCLSLTVLFFSLFSKLGNQASSGIGLFFHSFRFHSLFEFLIYFALSPFAEYTYLSGTIALIMGGTIYLFYLYAKNRNLNEAIFVGFLLMLLFSPVIHPWYTLPLFALLSSKIPYTGVFLVFSIFSGFSYLLYSIQYTFFSDFFFMIEGVSLFACIYGRACINYFRKKSQIRKGKNKTCGRSW
ncbi:hypothetical protein [Leptospira ilyithenensis]|uniref:DUF2029 domain-containing protein n=1 Tax=Leptospira ilyithenensis TaxID=2484901 RepID=A0A4V3JWS8_9LEPT|nr:hypothetical protein [Leptospira ilyithenensis]TGN07159.1 hypothetical protein EHS11_18820 [Leptospira ilyithenensis]